MTRVINKHQNINTIFVKTIVLITGYLISKNMLFEDLSLSKSIQRAVNKAILTPSHSEQSIPLVLAGKDLIGCAQTGTGKSSICHTYYTSIAPYRRIIKKAKQIRAVVT
jgi:ATP-dependent RNA helicase RhlE